MQFNLSVLLSQSFFLVSVLINYSVNISSESGTLNKQH